MGILPQQRELFVASQMAESLGGNSRLMEIILDQRNMFRALNRVRANKGAPGVDGMEVTQLGGYLKRHWLKIRENLLTGEYTPLPVRRKEIDKPDGGVRLLGIPTVLDRLVQQTIARFCNRYGTRPFRNPAMDSMDSGLGGISMVPFYGQRNSCLKGIPTLSTWICQNFSIE